MSHYNKSSDRSVPFSTSRDYSTSDYFPLSSQSPRLGNSSFDSTRNKIFNNLSEFEDQLPSNKMFVDRSPFGSSFDHPRMMSGSRNLDMSNSFRDEMDEQVNHHPRVFNIPIQVETPEGFVPLVRSNSNTGSPFNGNRGNMSQLADPVGSDFTFGSPSERPGYIHQRPVKSPTPPPKPKFSRNRPEFHHQPYQHNPGPFSHSHPRVHSIPVKIERSGKSQQPTRNDSPQPYDEVNHPNSPKHDTFFGGRRSRSSSESESHQPDVNRSVNIPIQIVKTQSSEPQNASTESNQPVNLPNPPQPCENKEKTPPDPIELINEIEKEACRLEKEVIEFNGEYLDKKYRYLDEMLTRCMLKLDSIDSNGRDEVRMARRSTLAHVDHCLAILEGKVNKPKPEENLNETTNQCDEQAETANMESEPVQQENEESISNESPACEMSDDQKNDMMETENNSDETNISVVDELEPKSTPVSDNVNTDELTCKPEVSFDQLDLETSSADSTRVYLDDTAHNSQSEQMSQDLEANESDNSPEPKVEFPPDDNPDELVDKESMDIEVKASPDPEALDEPEQSISSTTESLVVDEKSSNTEYRVESTEVQEPDSSSTIIDNSIEKEKKID